MIISGPIDPHRLVLFRHYRRDLLARVYPIAWKPRFGWRRKYIGEPLMRRVRGLLPRPGNEFHLSFEHHAGARTVSVRTDDLQLAPAPAPPKVMEPDLFVMLGALAPDLTAFYDIGANYGFFSLRLACLESFHGKAYAFEPTPKTFQNLAQLVRAIDPEGRIEPVNIALSDRSGTAAMRLPVATHSGYAQITKDGDYEVETQCLDDWRTASRSPPSFMKLDVEGHELQVLHGARVTIDQYRPIVRYENWRTIDRATNDAIYGFLASRGYRLFMPGWLTNRKDLWSISQAVQADRINRLALIELAPETLHERSMIYGVNVLALPREKVDWFRARLGDYSLPPQGASD